jgi:hypothetical protein
VPPTPELLVALEVHVEGWTYSSDAQLEMHLVELEELADIAGAHGAVLSFELGHQFTVALRNAGRSDWVTSVLAQGHDVQMHADVGGSGTPSLSTLTSQLNTQLADLSSIGVEPSVVTGVCSRGPWVEAVAGAGIPSVAGMVEYCMHALDPTNDPAEFNRTACRTPASCHDALGTVLDLDVPWFAATSADFLTPVSESTAGAVLLIPGSEGPICGSEGASGTACSWDAGDPAGFAAKLAEAVSVRSTSANSVFTSAWSVGSPVDATLAEQLFTELENVVADGGVRWVRISDVTG